AAERQIHGDRVPVPNVSGWSVDGATEYLESEGFEVEIGEPMEHNWADEGDVGATQPASGTRVTPGSTITLRPVENSSDDGEDDDNHGNNGNNGNSGNSGGNRNSDASARGSAGSGSDEVCSDRRASGNRNSGG